MTFPRVSRRNLPITIMLCVATVTLTGCTNEQIYETLHDYQYMDGLNCLDLPHSQQQECMQRANISYGQYHEQREKLLKKQQDSTKSAD